MRRLFMSVASLFHRSVLMLSKLFSGFEFAWLVFIRVKYYSDHAYTEKTIQTPQKPICVIFYELYFLFQTTLDKIFLCFQIFYFIIPFVTCLMASEAWKFSSCLLNSSLVMFVVVVVKFQVIQIIDQSPL